MPCKEIGFVPTHHRESDICIVVRTKYAKDNQSIFVEMNYELEPSIVSYWWSFNRLAVRVESAYYASGACSTGRFNGEVRGYA
jgi:hypothetical protein